MGWITGLVNCKKVWVSPICLLAAYLFNLIKIKLIYEFVFNCFDGLMLGWICSSLDTKTLIIFFFIFREAELPSLFLPLGSIALVCCD